MSAAGSLEPEPFWLEREGHRIGAEAAGEGPPVVLAHGLTAQRRYVLHGSKALARAGFETIAYDARGHGVSDPAPPGAGYGYGQLADDLLAMIELRSPDRRVVLAGHSMGAHTLTAAALREPERVAGIVVIGPVYDGEPSSAESLAYWDRLAAGLAEGGIEGFIAAYDEGLDPQWRETLLRLARQRLALHEHPEAVARALGAVARSRPFEDLSELERLELPALVIASHDEADPGHPYAVAERWAERLPEAALLSEEPGSSPLAWQGGRLSREIAAFCERPETAARLES